GLRHLLQALLGVCCFFFQAEDGIRDFHVTGVQTCALPIWPHPGPRRAAKRRPRAPVALFVGGEHGGAAGDGAPAPRGRARAGARSEERRVGREWGAAGAPAHPNSTETRARRAERATAACIV